MHHSIPAEHARHDLELIARHAAGDLFDNDQTRAEALLQACSGCTDLRRDLVAIAAATRTLPSRATAPRDFRLTAEHAARLHRGSRLRSLLRRFATPGSTVRPMALACTSFGLAGLVVATILPSLLGGATALAPQRDASGGAAAAAGASQNPEALPVSGAPGPTTDLNFGVAGQPPLPAGSGATKATESAPTAPEVALGGVPATATDDGGRTRANSQTSGNPTRTEPSPATPLLIGSLLLLLVGVALLGLQLAARRLR
jgi:hypothetical protein